MRRVTRAVAARASVVVPVHPVRMDSPESMESMELPERSESPVPYPLLP